MRSVIIFVLAVAVWPGSGIVRGEDAAGAVRAPARLVYPNGLAITNDDELLISDIGSHTLLKCDSQGRLSILAGTGKPGFSGDGGPATEARLNAPFEILVLAGEGGILVADTYNHRIRRIDRAGKISTIAGNGKSVYAGDGGPATAASLNLPQGIAVDSQGNLLIADTFNHVVRRVDRDGKISTIAGSEPGLAGDDGPATKAQLSLPMAVAVDEQDRIYISDGGNSRIRRVSGDGTIETVAGHGAGSGIAGAGFDGDGGPPEKAKIFSAADIEFGPAGIWYLSDSGNNRIRLVRDGLITTVAGKGAADFSGDGGPAIEAAFKAPQKMLVRPDGSIYVADRSNHRVRLIDAAGQIKTLVGESAPDASIRVGNN